MTEDKLVRQALPVEMGWVKSSSEPVSMTPKIRFKMVFWRSTSDCTLVEKFKNNQPISTNSTKAHIQREKSRPLCLYAQSMGAVTLLPYMYKCVSLCQPDTSDRHLQTGKKRCQLKNFLPQNGL